MNTAYMRNKRRQSQQWKKHLLLADMGIAMALEQPNVSQTLQISACSSPCLSLFLWDALSPWSRAGGGTQPCAFGTRHLQDMASALMPRCKMNQSGHSMRAQPTKCICKGPSQKSTCQKWRSPHREDVPWCTKSRGQCGGTLVWWSSLYFFFFHLQISSYQNAAKKKLTTPNTGNTHMIVAADHILPNLSSSWPTQHMSLQRTIHPLPKGVWVQPEFPWTLVKIGHDLWKPSTVLKTKDLLMMPD